jgi:C_GCAxxG_C_C family probable redox protein
VCQELGFEVENTVIPQIASGFAGGIGNTGAVCGAVVGAVMAISLTQKRAETIEEMFANLQMAAEFRRRFEDKMGTIHCRELTGADLTTDQGIEELMNSDIAETVCFPAVMTAYELVIELMQGAA